MKNMVLTLCLMSAASSIFAMDIYDMYKQDTSVTADMAAANAAAELDAGGGHKFTRCSPSWAETQLKDLDSTLIKGPAALAAAKGSALTEQAAACALYYRDKQDPTGDSSIWALLAGEGLAAIVLSGGTAAHAGKAAERARAYLNYAGSAKYARVEETLQMLEKATGPDAVSDSPQFKSTSQNVVAEYLENRLGFWGKYDGKVIELTGKVLNITGYGGVASVVLDGSPENQSMDQHGFQHEVECEIKVAAEIDKASRLEKGRRITVSGQISKGHLIPVLLRGCVIRN